MDPETGELVAKVACDFYYVTTEQRAFLEANLNKIVEFGSK
jgi:hypothetical protein